MNLAQIQEASTTDLREELTKLKDREKKIKAENARKANKLVSSVLGIGSAGLAGWYMGTKRKEVEAKPEWAGWDDETKQKELAKAQGVMGFDLDLIAGLATFGLGLSEAADEYSDTLVSIGTGLLASFAGRAAEKKFATPTPVEQA
jgi:hypothetical protein